jgi:hypothetical protein
VKKLTYGNGNASCEAGGNCLQLYLQDLDDWLTWRGSARIRTERPERATRLTITSDAAPKSTFQTDDCQEGLHRESLDASDPQRPPGAVGGEHNLECLEDELHGSEVDRQVAPQGDADHKVKEQEGGEKRQHQGELGEVESEVGDFDHGRKELESTVEPLRIREFSLRAGDDGLGFVDEVEVGWFGVVVDGEQEDAEEDHLGDGYCDLDEEPDQGDEKPKGEGEAASGNKSGGVAERLVWVSFKLEKGSVSL